MTRSREAQAQNLGAEKKIDRIYAKKELRARTTDLTQTDYGKAHDWYIVFQRFARYFAFHFSQS